MTPAEWIGGALILGLTFLSVGIFAALSEGEGAMTYIGRLVRTTFLSLLGAFVFIAVYDTLLRCGVIR